ncbi:uncharacterized protein BROUX77_000244 [Berkeleyomyces rouxiae]|uniref:uncharacterized protein n=1 Tax=Berkeleyomyces rouxiae TaxID=2035830 RepID=UPI003B7B6AF6
MSSAPTKTGPTSSRKRASSGTCSTHQSKPKKQKAQPAPAHYDHAVLSHYFPRVQTLRQYLMAQLPKTSRICRKKLAALGRKSRGGICEPSVLLAADFLDSTLVGVPDTLDASLAISDGGNGKCVIQAQKENRKTAVDDDVPRSTLPVMRQQFSELSMMDETYVTFAGTQRTDFFCQSEIVDFCIWFIFDRKRGISYPKHMLCDGYERGTGGRFPYKETLDRPIPGISLKRRNEQVEMLKQEPWPRILALLGHSGEAIMVHMLLNCGVFVTLKSGAGNLLQLSGVPLINIPLRSVSREKNKDKKATADASNLEEHDGKTPLYTPLQIEFIRSRVLYGRAVLTAKGNIKVGFRHIHVLNRYPLASGKPKDQLDGDEKSIKHGEQNDNIDSANDTRSEARFAFGDASTLKIMAYIFPRQFGLHNVFTSKVDYFKTSQKFQDYTIRDDELNLQFSKVIDGKQQLDIKIPKRLRGDAHRLVWRLQVLHNRCCYPEMLRHYCPTQLDPLRRTAYETPTQALTANASKTSNILPGPGLQSAAKRKSGKRPLRKANSTITLEEGQTLTDLATPAYQVSAFCQGVLSKIIPHEFWGLGNDQSHNKRAVMLMVDRFVNLRRFERMTLHDVVQDFKIAGIAWLAPPGLRGNKMSQTDRSKRLEILHEFLYYIFDSLLIPLLHSNFYITESNSDRYRVYYFRHDVWRVLSRPAMADLKSRMFTEVSAVDAQALLASRQLGCAALRLLPKTTTMRPIMNLRKRQLARAPRKGLGQSINSLLVPWHSVLKLEKQRQPEITGSSLGGREEIFGRLKRLVLGLPTPLPRLYFVKVDVQSAFDTIPQEAVVDVIEKIPREPHYHITKHVEMKPGPKTIGPGGAMTIGQPGRRWINTAVPVSDRRSFVERLEDGIMGHPEPGEGGSSRGEDRDAGGESTPPELAAIKFNTTFHGGFPVRTYPTRFMQKLLHEHIKANIVRIGRKYYVQKRGIPQGSVLSADLCNLFYASMETNELSFLHEPSGQRGHGSKDTLLMRLIDDSLLITTDRTKAQRFAETMLRGLPQYGITVNPLKSLVNFDCVVDGVRVPRGNDAAFPYCGTVINCRTLGVAQLRGKLSGQDISHILSVEYSRNPGQVFQKRVLNSFRIQSQAMFYDSTHNPTHLVHANLRDAMREIARRTWAYIRCLPRSKKPTVAMLIRTTKKLIEVAHLLLNAHNKAAKFPGYKCEVSRSHVHLTVTEAFGGVFANKAERYSDFARWLRVESRTAAAWAAGLSKKKALQVSGGSTEVGI